MRSKYEEYLICKERGHKDSEYIVCDFNTPEYHCKYCDTFFSFDCNYKMIESRIPEKLNLDNVHE